MMAKLKSKKLTLALLIVLALSLVAVGTYAWFTDSVTTSPFEPELGTLLIDAELDFSQQGPVLYQPGMDPIEVTGSIKNIGTLPFCAKVTMNVKTTLRWDVANKVLLPPASWIENDPDPNVPGTIASTLQSWTSSSSGKGAVWFKDLNDPSTFYVIMSPDTEHDTIPAVIEVPKTLGNTYMAALIQIAPTWEATQSFPEAILDELGVDISDPAQVELITPVILPSGGNDDIYAFLNEMLGGDYF